MSDSGRYFILLQKKVGKKKEKGLVSSFRGSVKVDLLAGSLLILVETLTGRTGSYILVLETFESEREIVEVECIPGEVENIELDVLNLLRPVPVQAERLAVYLDKEWLQEGRTLAVDDPVFVKIKGHHNEIPGVIRYRGPVVDYKGEYFGIELKENVGTSDGTFRKQRYFKCSTDFGFFCPIHKVRKDQQGWNQHIQGSMEEGAVGNTGQQNINKNCSLKLGDRIVWVSDSGPEPGSVKWIGVLPDDVHGDVTVGVEFDNRVGSGTGKYRDTRLFFAKQGHASLVPIMGLVKEEEFYGPSQQDEDISNGGRSKTEVIREQMMLMQQHQASQSQQAAPQTWTPLLPTAPLPTPASPPSPPAIQRTPSQSGKTTVPDVSEYKARLEMHEQRVAECSTSNVNKLPSYKEAIADGMYENFSGLNPLYEISKNEMPISTGSSEDRSSGMDDGRHQPNPDPDLTEGSMVEVRIPGNPARYGVIRWIGTFEETQPSRKLIAGLEMDEEISAGTDGTFRGERFFLCAPKRALFVPLYKCIKDKRFQNPSRKREGEEGFGCIETPDIAGTVAPPTSLDAQSIYGKNRGIQGHHNSCYLDATLFAMFYFTTVFDSILYRPRRRDDIHQYEEVQKVLREGIVNPLRRNSYVRADKVLKLRALLDKLGKIPGMMGEEKDPEEFLSLLLVEIMKADPLLHLSSGENSYFYQLFMEKDEKLLLPTTQKLVELSFVQSNVKLKEVPSCLIIQMPRFGKDYKMYRRIIPSLELDITDILENDPRECIICGELAAYECKECYQIHGPGLNTTAFCETCSVTSHQHKLRRDHRPKRINVYPAFKQHLAQRRAEAQASEEPYEVVLPRVKMELFAVVCIQTSHYVSFVKCGHGKNAEWVFFDSMADRMGEQGGYNIPEVKHVPEVTEWLSETRFQQIVSTEDDKDLPEFIRRLLCDVYMCMYQSTEVMLFN